MVILAEKLAEFYGSFRELLSEARKTELRRTDAYAHLIRSLDELAMALHRMLYLEEILDPSSAQRVEQALMNLGDIRREVHQREGK